MVFHLYIPYYSKRIFESNNLGNGYDILTYDEKGAWGNKDW